MNKSTGIERSQGTSGDFVRKSGEKKLLLLRRELQAYSFEQSRCYFYFHTPSI
jgi:hypothetical protein